MKIIICFTLLLLAFACTSIFDNDSDYIRQTGRVDIDKFSVTDSAGSSNLFKIKARSVAFNGCWKNLTFDFHKTEPFEYSLEAFGVYESSGICPDMMVYKDTLIIFRPIEKGKYVIVVRSKVDSIRRDTVVVK